MMAEFLKKRAHVWKVLSQRIVESVLAETKGRESRRTMTATRVVLVLSVVACLFLPPYVACAADCVDLKTYTSWVATSPHGVLFSHGNRPLALMDVSDCIVHPLSRIELPKSDVCDSDALTIDGKTCHVLNVMAFD